MNRSVTCRSEWDIVGNRSVTFRSEWDIVGNISVTLEVSGIL